MKIQFLIVSVAYNCSTETNHYDIIARFSSRRLYFERAVYWYFFSLPFDCSTYHTAATRKFNVLQRRLNELKSTSRCSIFYPHSRSYGTKSLLLSHAYKHNNVSCSARHGDSSVCYIYFFFA